VLREEVENEGDRSLQNKAHANRGPGEMARTESHRQQQTREKQEDFDGLDGLERPVDFRHARELGLDGHPRTGAQTLLKTSDLRISTKQESCAERELSHPGNEERPDS
jgi:hypothetical protein